MSDIGRPTPEPPLASGSAPGDVVGRAILVVDDEPSIRRFVAETLRARGFEVVAAAGGREALRAVYERSLTPALVISDIDMPGMTGVELAARLSADRPGVRIVLMTGHPDSADIAREHREVVAAVLLKPFSADDLVATVDAVIGRPGEPPSTGGDAATPDAG